MGSPFQNAGYFLIDTLFSLYIYALILRLLLQMVRADFYNPLSQFLVKITNPPLIPLRRIIPGFAGIDVACVVLILFFILIKFLLIYALIYQFVPNAIGLLILTGGDLVKSLVQVYFFAIIVLAIMSWVSPQTMQGPVGQVLRMLTEPLLRPVRKIIPPISGFDLSPLFVLIGLQLFNILVTSPLVAFGLRMAGS